MDEMRYQLDLLRAINQKLTGQERMYRMISDTSDSAFLYYSFQKDEFHTLGNWDKYFSFQVKSIKDLAAIFDLVEEKYIISLREILFPEKNQKMKESMQCRLKDNRTWYRFETNVCYDEDGNPTDKVIRIGNITKSKAQNEELTYMAYYDALTGLYNRNYFVSRLVEFVRRAEEEKSIISVMFLDLDNFRQINDGMGIVIGDEIVQQFGQFLGTFSSDNVIVSHLNGDIYCLAIYDPCGIRSVEHIYRSIQERTKAGFLLVNGERLDITVSIGVAEYPEAATSALELINCAEIVMFKAKAFGKNSIQYFDAPILNEFLQNIAIENKLKNAVFEENFTIYFQPQYYIKDKTLRGMEALIRWQDDDGTMISPSVFIPIAEKNGTIVSIGTWVIEECVKQYAKWSRQYDYPMILSINISAIQYKRRDFTMKMIQALRKYDVDPNHVELEITESILIDDFQEMKEKLLVLRDYGIRISLDDFGTGFSSLSYLKGLPIDTLKIDKSFIDTVTTDVHTRIITESIVSMVRNLGYETVAEGVETEEQFVYLNTIGCDVIQGYLLGKPMPAQDIEQLLTQL